MSTTNNYYLSSKKPYQHLNTVPSKFGSDKAKPYLSSYLSPKNSSQLSTEFNSNKQQSSSPLAAHKKSYISQSYDNLPSSNSNSYSSKLEGGEFYKTNTTTTSYQSSSSNNVYNGISSHKNQPNKPQLNIASKKYKDTKNSYALDSRQNKYASNNIHRQNNSYNGHQQLTDHGKNNSTQQVKKKRMPRLSQPNYMPDQYVRQDKQQQKKQQVLQANFAKRKYQDTAKLNDKERLLMRKSSIDCLSSQSWIKQLPMIGKKQFGLNNFQKIKQLGVGKYGTVFLVRQKATGEKLLKQQEITEQFIRQLKIQLFLNHPNIIKMYGFFDDAKNIYIILQVGMGGQLFKQIKRGQTIPQPKVAGIMRQVCSAVAELHSNQIIHRDIKPQNIVMHENVVKLCDFGWSVHRDQKLRTTFCGTPLYVCPQILRGRQYDEKIDIWSLGVMMYEMLIGQNPFNILKEEDLIKIVKQNVMIPKYANISSEAQRFLFSCLQKKPADRSNIRQLLNHDFFKKYPQKNYEKKMGL